MYTPMKLNVPSTQHDKLKEAARQMKPVSIRVDVNSSGNHEVVLLTHSQIQRLERASLIAKPKLSIKLSKKQVKANVEHRGGFLGILAGLAAKALPSQLGGLATGLTPVAAKRVLGGDGLYLHKLGHCVKIDTLRGNGLYLTPHKKLRGIAGDDLYLKRGSTIQDGSGLLLGKNSTFKNIPILNLLL